MSLKAFRLTNPLYFFYSKNKEEFLHLRPTFSKTIHVSLTETPFNALSKEPKNASFE